MLLSRRRPHHLCSGHRQPEARQPRHRTILTGQTPIDGALRGRSKPYNDPYGEHDFGSFDHDGRTISWKIDLYDRDYKWYSPAPTDPAKTNRVLTILLAEEY